MTDSPDRTWQDAVSVASLMAVDPVGLGGVHLRAAAGPVRDAWIACLRQALPPGTPVRRMPLGIGDAALLGGLDLGATLEAGRSVMARGLLAETDGGVVLLPMAERLSSATVARLAATLDSGVARLGVVALDEGIAMDEIAPAALRDRLAFSLDLNAISPRMAVGGGLDDITAARALLPGIAVSGEMIEALAVTAEALGVGSVRALLLAMRAAAAAAALAGRDVIADEDLVLAGRLVLAPRATRLPAPPEQEREAPPPPPPESQQSEDEERDPGEMADMLLAAISASLPEGLLARLRAEAAGRAAAKSAGRTGELRNGNRRGRPAGVRRAVPRDGQRLNVIETLRAAAPWQRLRQANGRVAVRAEDFRVTRMKSHSETCTIFAVDASGSQALNRLAETKGAVERLLADCYVRRDRVAVIGFRGKAAEVLLPPTRSLVRAKRSLAGLPGGGGTPLAAGIDAASALADAVRRRGETPTVVILTDGQANVGRDGMGGRAKAEEDATAAARRLRALGVAVLLIDTSPRARPPARALAGAMGAAYLALPNADPKLISRAVQAAQAA